MSRSFDLGTHTSAVRTVSSGFFSQYGRLQLLVISRIISVLIIFYIATFVLFAILRVLTGISIKRIGYMSLRHITLHPKTGIEVRIGKFGVSIRRPTIARPGWISFEIANLDVTVTLQDLEERDRRTMASFAQEASTRNLFEEGVQSIPLLPTQNKMVLRIIQWLIVNLKLVNIHLASTSYTIKGVGTLVVSSANFNLDLRKNLPVMQANYFVGTLDSYKLRQSEMNAAIKISLVDVYFAEHINDEAPRRLVDYLVFDALGVLCLDHLGLKELSFTFTGGKLLCDMDLIEKTLTKVKKLRGENRRSTANNHAAAKSADSEKASFTSVLSKGEKQRLAKMGVSLLYLVKEVEFKISAIEFSKLQTPSPAKDEHGNPVSLAISMTDMTLNLRRMNAGSPSFKLLYNEKDTAHQAILNITSINFGLDSSGVQEELLYVPNFSMICRTNAFSRTLRYVQSDHLSVNDSSIVGTIVLNSPNFNIETHHLPILLEIFKSHSTHTRSKGPPGSIEEPLTIDMPFQNSLPGVELNISIFDPAFRVVVDCDVSPGAMFIASAGRIHSMIKSSHDHDTNNPGQARCSYKLDSTLEVNRGQLWYRSDSLPRFVISDAESIAFKVGVVTQPVVSVNVCGRLSDVSFAPTKYEIFNVFRSFFMSIRPQSKKDQSPRDAGRAPIEPLYASPNGGDTKRPSILRKLPPWLASVSINLENLDLVCASDKFRRLTTETLGLHTGIHKLQIDYHRDAEVKELGTFTDGRRLQISADGIHCYKVSNVYIAHRDQENAAKQAHWLELPSVSCVLATTTQEERMTTVSLKVSKLVVSANINLVLAAMVIREVVDRALARKGFEQTESQLSDAPKYRRKSTKSFDNMEKIVLQANVEVIRVKIDLPKEAHVMVELLDSHVKNTLGQNPVVTAKSAKLYSRHPFLLDSWCVILSIAHMKAKLNVVSRKEEEDLLAFDFNGLRINIPFKFQLYKIVDNGITLGKALNTLILQTRLGDPLLYLNPKKMPDLPNVPKISIKSSSVLLTLEDDPFEAQLNLIFKTSLVEALARLQKDMIFEHRVKEAMKRESKRLLDETAQDMSETASLHRSKSNSSRLRASNSANLRKLAAGQRASTDIPNEHNRIKHFATFGSTHGSENLLVDGIRRAVHRNEGDDTSHSSRMETPEVNAATESYRSQVQDQLNELMDTQMDVSASYQPHSDHNWRRFFHDDSFKRFRDYKVKYRPKDFLYNGDEASSDNGSDNLPKHTIATLHEKLVEHHSESWIRAIKYARETQKKGVKETSDEHFIDQIDPRTVADESVVNYSEHPFLFAASFKDALVRIEQTHHNTPEKLHQFLHSIGKGLPLDTKFSIFVPLWLDIRARGGMRINLRDFPLPVLHFPGLGPDQDPTKNEALHIKGNLIVTEQLVSSDKNIRPLYVPLTRVPASKANELGLSVIYVTRTLAPVKTYTDLCFRTQTNLPSRVTYASSYNPTFGFASAGFSNFSKPPIDISPPIGWWDKIRLILHGRLTFNLDHSPLYLLLKGERDPYALQGPAAGFAFVWKDNVQVRINPHDSSKDLFVVDANTFNVVVPDYTAWEPEYSTRPPSARARPFKTDYAAMEKPAKLVMKLGHQTRWKLGMMFERDVVGSDSGERTSEFIHHYDVDLSMPDFVKDKDGYDAYKGFRSDYIFLALSVTSNDVQNDSYNAVHLTPRVISHFMKWKTMFNSVFWPPQRVGKLWPDNIVKKTKFSSALSGHQYQLVLSPLLMSFFYRHRSVNQSNDKSSGLKARIEKFVFDFHARKEPVPGKQRWRTSFHVGEIDMVSTDVRVLSARFRDKSVGGRLNDLQNNGVTESLKSSSITTRKHASSVMTSQSANTGPSLSNEDSAWVDLDDFVELGVLATTERKNPAVEVQRFVYTPRFTYYHQTDNSGEAYGVHDGKKYKKFGYEMIHNCGIKNNYPEEIQIKLLRNRVIALKEELKDSYASIDALQTERERHPSNAGIKDKLKKTNFEMEVVLASQRVLEEQINHLQHQLCSYRPEETSEKKHNSQDSVYQNLFPCGHTSAGKGPNGTEPVASTYRNQFMIHSINIKWNNKVRDLILRLKTLVEMEKEEQYNQSRNAVRYLESLIKKIEETGANGDIDADSVADILSQVQKEEAQRDEHNSSNGDDSSQHSVSGISATNESAADRLARFDDDLVQVGKNEELMRSFLVRFMTPQVQVISKENPSNCIQVTARNIELRVVTIYDKLHGQDRDSARIERRFGVSFDGAGAYVLTEADARHNVLNSVCTPDFGVSDIDVAWPAWLSIEFCYAPGVLRRFLIIENTSFGVRFDRLNQFHVEDDDDDSTSSVLNGQNGRASSRQSTPRTSLQAQRPKKKKQARFAQLRIDSPKIVATCDSVQYYAAYLIGQDLLSYTDPIEEESKKAIERVLLGTDFTSDLQRSLWQIKSLQADIYLLKSIKRVLLTKAHHYSRQDLVDLLRVELEYRRGTQDLMFMMRAFKQALRQCTRSSTSNTLRTLISVDFAEIKLLNEDGHPFAEIITENSRFQRVRRGDQWAHNKAEIGTLRAFNLSNDAFYPEMILPHRKQPLAKKKGVAVVEWTNLDPVGGITIIEDFTLELQPVLVQLERELYERVFKFAFPKHDADAEGKDDSDDDEEVKVTEISDDDDSIVRELAEMEGEALHLKPNASNAFIGSSHKKKSKEPATKTKRRWFVPRILKRMNDNAGDDVSEMLDRAANFLNIVNFHINSTLLSVSYKGKSHLNLLDLQEVDFPVPHLHYRNKLWTKLDLMMRLKNDLIKVALQNTGSILSNKFTPHVKAKINPHARGEHHKGGFIDATAPFRTISRLSIKSDHSKDGHGAHVPEIQPIHQTHEHGGLHPDDPLYQDTSLQSIASSALDEASMMSSNSKRKSLFSSFRRHKEKDDAGDTDSTSTRRHTRLFGRFRKHDD